MNCKIVALVMVTAMVILSGCNTVTETKTGMGDIPQATGTVKAASESTVKEDEGLAASQETTTEDLGEPETDDIALATYPKPSSGLEEIDTEGKTTVPQLSTAAGADITFSGSFSLGNMGLSFSLPTGYDYVAGSSDYARFTNPEGTVEFYIFSRIQDPLATDVNNIRLMFKQKSPQLSYKSEGTEYIVWDLGVAATSPATSVNSLLITRDTLNLQLYEKKNYQLITPYALASYFTFNGNSYALVVVGASNEIAAVEALSDAVTPTVEQAEAITGLPVSTAQSVTDTANSVSFSLPSGWTRDENAERIVFRPDVSETDALQFLQVTCFLQTASFTESYKAPSQIPQAIAATYLRNPLSEENGIEAAVTTVNYLDVELGSGAYINRYEIKTSLNSISAEEKQYVQNEGIVSSYLYTFETEQGKAYAINVSSSSLNRMAMEEVALMIEKSLIF